MPYDAMSHLVVMLVSFNLILFLASFLPGVVRASFCYTNQDYHLILIISVPVTLDQ
jgi:hypothetical protein